MTSALIGLTIIGGTLFGVFFAGPIIKRTTPANAAVVTLLAMGVPLLVLYLLNLAGPITNLPVFFVLMFLTTLAMGAGFIPGGLVTMECMDYNKFTVGKSMEGSLNSVVLFIQKMQGALAAAATGAILIAVGYDAERFETATSIPAELFSGLGLIMFGLPALACVLAAAAMWFYPMRRPADRDAMYAILRPEIEGELVGATVSSDPALVDAGEAIAEKLALPIADDEKP